MNLESISKFYMLLRTTSKVSSLINEIGIIKKKIKNHYFLSPFNQDLKAISIMCNEKNIAWIGITLHNPSFVRNLISEHGRKYTFQYNHFDDETVLIFGLDKGIELRCILNENVQENELQDATFSRLKMIKKN